MTPDYDQARQAIFDAVEGQLADPKTPEVRSHFDRLVVLGIAESEARMMIASELITCLSAASQTGSFSYPDYVARLARLPESFEEENDDDPMEDDYFLPILFEIESRINQRDREARARGIVFTDSQVRSILNKVRKQAGGGAPKLTRNSERDQLLAGLYDALLETWATITIESEDSDEESDLPASDWVISLRRVEDSIRMHTAGSGSRDYLDYIDDFLPAEKDASESPKLPGVIEAAPDRNPDSLPLA